MAKKASSVKKAAKKTARSKAKSPATARSAFVKKAMPKKASPKKATPKRLVAAVKVVKPSNPARRGVTAMAIQSVPDGVPTGKKTVPAAAKSGPTGMPREGELAPDFTLPDCDGRAMQLAKLRGTPVVIYFYPKDDTPGCTIEAQEFTRDAALFKKKGIVVIGISKDDTASHCKFRDKYKLNVNLLSDVRGEVVQRYGVWMEKSMYGKKFMGIQRATFVVAADGYIMKVFPNVNPQGHSQEILKLFK